MKTSNTTETTILNLVQFNVLKKTIIYTDGSKKVKYFIIRNSDGVKFDLENNWNSNSYNCYLTKATQQKLIYNIKTNYSHLEEVKRFIDWYENQNSITSTGNKTENKDENKNENVSTQTLNEILEQIKTQNDYIRVNIIEAITEKILQVKAEEIANRLTNSVDKYINDTYGALPLVYEFNLPEKTVTQKGIFHHNLPKVMRYIQLDIPLMLVGPAGSGKNYTLEKAAETLGLDFYFTNAITQEYKLTGFIDAYGKYHETEFYKAFKNGGVFFLDEIDASIPEAIIILNAAIANKYFDFPNGRIKAHENFRVVAAANTYGLGSNLTYCGRSSLDGATLDRFVILDFDYDSDVEKSLCPDKDLYEFILQVRLAIQKRNLRFIVSTRAMINAYKMLKDDNFTKKEIIKTAIIKSMKKDDIKSILNILNDNNSWVKALKELA